jgi:hypothetical protein
MIQLININDTVNIDIESVFIIKKNGEIIGAIMNIEGTWAYQLNDSSYDCDEDFIKILTHKKLRNLDIYKIQ